MSTPDTEIVRHPANAVFALMEDREFRYSIIRPALEKDKEALCRLSTGKHQLKGFRYLNRAPNVMIVPVLSDEANLSAELARALLERWFEDQAMLKGLVAAKLQLLGYEPAESPFDERGEIGWNTMSEEHAEEQFEGTFLTDQDKNHVMLMSLLLGWFGHEQGEEDDADADTEAEA